MKLRKILTVAATIAVLTGSGPVPAMAADLFGKTTFYGDVAVGSWLAVTNLSTTNDTTTTDGVYNLVGTRYTNYFKLMYTNLLGRSPLSAPITNDFEWHLTLTNASKVTWTQKGGAAAYFLIKSFDEGANYTNYEIVAASASSWIDTGTNTWDGTVDPSTLFSVIPAPTVPWTAGAADNLGNHTATQTLNMVGLGITNLLAPVAGPDAMNKAYSDANYQPLEATLTDIADGTIAENLVNTANPWADNEVVDTITASSYLLLAGGTLTGDTTLDDGVGQSPILTIKDQSNDSGFLQKIDGGAFEIVTTSDEPILLNPGNGGGHVMIDGGLTVGDTTDPGDNNLNVIGTFQIGGVALNLEQNSDVDLDTPSDGEVWTYNGPSGVWSNEPSAGGGAFTPTLVLHVDNSSDPADRNWSTGVETDVRWSNEVVDVYAGYAVGTAAYTVKSNGVYMICVSPEWATTSTDSAQRTELYTNSAAVASTVVQVDDKTGNITVPVNITLSLVVNDTLKVTTWFSGSTTPRSWQKEADVTWWRIWRLN